MRRTDSKRTARANLDRRRGPPESPAKSHPLPPPARRDLAGRARGSAQEWNPGRRRPRETGGCSPQTLLSDHRRRRLWAGSANTAMSRSDSGRDAPFAREPYTQAAAWEKALIIAGGMDSSINRDAHLPAFAVCAGERLRVNFPRRLLRAAPVTSNSNI